MEIVGNITGIKNNLLIELKSLYEVSLSPNEPISLELAMKMAALTDALNREIAVYINRRGQIVQVAVGTAQAVTLPPVDGRRSLNRLSGIRCIHTHPNGSAQLSKLDLSALREMRFDLMAAMGIIAGEIIDVSFAVLNNEQIEEPLSISLQEFVAINLAALISQLESQCSKSADLKSIIAQTETAFLVGLEGHNLQWDANDSLQELAQLAKTAGVEVLGWTTQKRAKPDPALFIGRGKANELARLRQEQAITVFIFDDELSPAQQRNLEELLGCKIIDRTALILDIFAQRARSHEGNLQVELALLRYHLPRLSGKGISLSRLGGGIGTRGPGETKLESDRRRLRSRIHDIQQQLILIERQRTVQRKERLRTSYPSVALVGYTNAGKSTLMNHLTAAGVVAEDKLFATLDPTTRCISLANGQNVFISDTVGFIQKLPHGLIAAFKATLEEVVHADLLLHIVDISHPQYKEQMTAVQHVLMQLGVHETATIIVYNKVDKLPAAMATERLVRNDNTAMISALSGDGISELTRKMEVILAKPHVMMTILIPYEHSRLLSILHEQAIVSGIEYQEAGIEVTVGLPEELVNQFLEFKITTD